MRLSNLMVLLAIILLAGCASLTDRGPSHEDPFAMPVDEFMQEHADLRASLLEGDPRELDEDEWKEFNALSTELVHLVGDATEIEEIEMSDRHRIYELRTDMDEVVGEVNSRPACTHSPMIGSRMRKSRRC